MNSEEPQNMYDPPHPEYAPPPSGYAPPPSGYAPPPSGYIQPGHIDYVFAWHNKQGKDEYGRIPVIVKPDPEETKRKRTL